MYSHSSRKTDSIFPDLFYEFSGLFVGQPDQNTESWRRRQSRRWSIRCMYAGRDPYSLSCGPRTAIGRGGTSVDRAAVEVCVSRAGGACRPDVGWLSDSDPSVEEVPLQHTSPDSVSSWQL